MSLALHANILAEIEEKFLRNAPKKIWSEGSSGEWEWIEKNRRFDFISQLEQRDIDGLGRSLLEFPESPAWFGVVTPPGGTENSPRFLAGKKVSPATFKNFHVLNNFLEGHRGEEVKQVKGVLESSLRLLETTVPAAGESSYFKSTILADTPRHLYFGLKTLACSRDINFPAILEIGIGYGGGLNSLLRLARLQQRKISMFGIDLPPTLVLAYYMLRMQGWSVQVVLNADGLPVKEKADICLVSSHLAGHYPFHTDGVLNFRSFSEMGRSALDFYLNQINLHWKPRFVLMENADVLEFPDSPRHIESLLSAHVDSLAAYDTSEKLFSTFSGGQGRYFEALLLRTR